MAASTHSHPTPERFFNAINAYQLTEAMRAALELGIFTAIAEGNVTAATIGKRCQAAERGIRILADFLVIHGFLTKDASGYALAPDSQVFLNRQSPVYLGGTIDFLLTQRLRQGHERLTDAVRKGGCAIGAGTLEPENVDWVKFAEAMMPLATMLSQTIAAELRKGGEARKVLDIAAGHGMFGISVAKECPSAQVYACDWQNVLAVANKNAAAHRIAARYHLLPGDAFEVNFGTDYDLVLIPNFLHHFDVPSCTRFIAKVHKALQPGGRAAIAEFIPNSDRVTPPTAAAFAMMMLATTPSGDAYTYEELAAMCREAGFARIELSPVQAGLDRLVIAHK